MRPNHPASRAKARGQRGRVRWGAYLRQRTIEKCSPKQRKPNMIPVRRQTGCPGSQQFVDPPRQRARRPATNRSALGVRQARNIASA